MINYHSIEDIVTANRRAGGRFFSEENMKCFKTRLNYRVFNGSFFITSEPDAHRAPNTRMYTVRMITSEGDIETIFKYRQFSTVSAAARAIQSLPPGFRQGYEFICNAFNLGASKAVVINEAGMNTIRGMAVKYILGNHKDVNMSFVSYYHQGKED